MREALIEESRAKANHRLVNEPVGVVARRGQKQITMPEGRRLLPDLTVEDNLLIYAYLHGVRPSVAKQRMKSVATEFEIDARMGDTVQQLSLGTKRRKTRGRAKAS